MHDDYQELLERFTNEREFAMEVMARAIDSPKYFSAARVGLFQEPSAHKLLKEIENWHAMASQAIANRIMEIPFQVGTETRVNGELVVDPLFDHPVIDILANPNPQMVGDQMIRLISQWLTTTGEAFLLKVGNSLDRPEELWPLSPAQMRPLTDESEIIAWEYTSGSVTARYAVDEIIRIWFPNPENHWTAEGELGPQAVTSDSVKFLDETMLNYWAHDATPKFALTPRDGAQLPEASLLKRFYREWTNRFSRRKGNVKGTPVILPSNFEIHEFANFQGFESVTNMMGFYRDKMLMASRVPPFVLGKDTNVNRATAETTLWAFDRHAILPQVTIISRFLTKDFAKAWDPNLVISFADFISPDKHFELAQENQDLEQKVRTINEVREMRGLAAADWGEDPVGTFGDQPYTPQDDDTPAAFNPFEPSSDEEEDEDQVDEEEDETDEEDEEDRARAHVVSSEAWEAALANERLWVPRFDRAYRAVLRTQEFAVQRLLVAEARSSHRRISEKQLLDLVRKALEPGRWTALFRSETGKVRRDAYESIGLEALRALQPEGEFNFSVQTAKRLLEHESAFVVNTSNTTIKALSSEIFEALAVEELAGSGLEARANAIRKAVGKEFTLRRKQARLIAQTEMLRSSQAAQVDGFEQSGVVQMKRWNTSQDELVRPSHRRLDGVTQPLRGLFQVGRYQGGHPGAVTLGPEESINCRCFLTPVVSEG